MSRGALAALQARRYSGNIRELRNLIERATILVDGQEIEARHFDAPPVRVRPSPQPAADETTSAFVVAQPISLAELERRYVRWVGDRLPGDRAAQAAALELGKRTFYRKLKAAAEG
jgi:DNA-binding NtrC family response regulator